jgi:hypothetical protein
MFLRALLLSLTLLAVAVPAADAAVADRYLPVHDASDGVHVKVSEQQVAISFSPAASRLWRTLAGRGTTGLCATLAPAGTELVLDASSRTRLGVLPRKPGSARLVAEDADVCSLGTTRTATDTSCLPLRYSEDPCTRVVVALTDRGRAYVDALARTLELAAIPELGLDGLGTDLVLLASADASPPMGKIGYWEQGTSNNTVVMLKDGRRRFLRRDADVFTTNDPRLVRTSVAELTLIA